LVDQERRATRLRWKLVPNPNPTAALQIVLAEERAKGWTPRDLGAKEQLRYGCDILSAPPDGGDPHRIEVKAMGRPFLTKTGKWSWPDIVVRQSQLDACKGDRGDSFRFEIVANLDAHRKQGDPYERLTLTAKDVVGNEASRVQLLVKLNEGLKTEIRRSL
jgi:hypothetical protein